MSRRAVVFLVIILLFALAIRLYGVGFGLPFIYDPDERFFVEKSLQMIDRGDPNPHWFGHPGSTVIYINTLIFNILGDVATFVGLTPETTEATNAYLKDPSPFLLAPRIFSSLIGTATVLVAFLIARRIYGVTAGLVAALALTFSPLHVDLSQLVRTDVLAGLFVLLAAYHALSIFGTRDRAPYVWAGIMVGAAVATKYPSVIAGIMILVAALLSDDPWKSKLKRLTDAGLAAAVALFVCSPYLFIDHETVLGNISLENRSVHLSATGAGFVGNILWYLHFPLVASAGVPLLLLFLVSLWFAVVRRNKAVGVLFSFVAVYMVFISSLNLRWERWVVIVLPFLAIMAAGGLKELLGLVAARHQTMNAAAILCLAATVALGPIAVATLTQVIQRAGPDTRTAAREWVIENIPLGSRLLVEAYGPQLPSGRYKIFQPHDGGVSELSPSKRRNIIPQGQVASLDGISKLLEYEIDFVILSNFYDRFLAERDRYPAQVNTYLKLFDATTLTYISMPARGNTALADPMSTNRGGGPIIRVLSVPAALPSGPK